MDEEYCKLLLTSEQTLLFLMRESTDRLSVIVWKVHIHANWQRNKSWLLFCWAGCVICSKVWFAQMQKYIDICMMYCLIIISHSRDTSVWKKKRCFFLPGKHLWTMIKLIFFRLFVSLLGLGEKWKLPFLSSSCSMLSWSLVWKWCPKEAQVSVFNQTKMYLFIFAFCDIESFKVSSSEIGWPIRDEKQSCPAS